MRKYADAGGIATFNVSVLDDGTFQSGPAQLRVGSQTSGRADFDFGDKALTRKAVSIAGMTTVELRAKTDFSETVRQDVSYPTGGFTCGLDDYPGGENPHVISADTVDRGATTTATADDVVSLARARSLSR